MSVEKPRVGINSAISGLVVTALALGLGGLLYHEVLNFQGSAWTLLPALGIAALAAALYMYAQRAALARHRAQLAKRWRQVVFPLQIFLLVTILVFISVWMTGPILLHRLSDFPEARTSTAFVIRKMEVEWWRALLRGRRASSHDDCIVGSYLRVLSDDPLVLTELCVDDKTWSLIDVGQKLRMRVQKSEYGRNVANITPMAESSPLPSGSATGVNDIYVIAQERIHSLTQRGVIRKPRWRQDAPEFIFGQELSEGEWSLPELRDTNFVYVAQRPFDLPPSISLSPRYEFIVPQGTERPSGPYRWATVYDLDQRKCFGPEC